MLKKQKKKAAAAGSAKTSRKGLQNRRLHSRVRVRVRAERNPGRTSGGRY
jgi:hypothetical protein